MVEAEGTSEAAEATLAVAILEVVRTRARRMVLLQQVMEGYRDFGARE